MENGSKSLRERLLARYKKMLFWDRATATILAWLAIGVFMMTNSTWGRPKLDTNGTIMLNAVAAVLFFSAAIYQVGYQISRSKVDLLKEVKQVQLQLLELQASLRKDS